MMGKTCLFSQIQKGLSPSDGSEEAKYANETKHFSSSIFYLAKMQEVTKIIKEIACIKIPQIITSDGPSEKVKEGVRESATLSTKAGEAKLNI